MVTLALILNWLSNNWGLLSAIWLLFSGVFGVVWRNLSEAERAYYAVNYPRIDALARAVRKSGMDFLPFVAEFARAITGKSNLFSRGASNENPA